MYLDSCRSQAADEGDAIEAHSPEEGRAGGLHHKVLQENPQLCEQGPDREGDGQNIRRSVNPGLQKALHVYWREKRKKKKKECLPTVRVSSGGVTQSQKAVINEGLQQAALSAERGRGTKTKQRSHQILTLLYKV